MRGKNDETKFAQLIKGLAGVFNSKGTLSPIKIELYFKALEDLPIAQIERSVSELIRDREYTIMPLPAHIRKNIQLPAQLMNGLSAWLIVEKCLEGGPKPEDPVINKTVDGMGGFDRLGRISYGELTWTQKEFERRFELLNHRRDQFELPEPQKDRLKLVEINPKVTTTNIYSQKLPQKIIDEEMTRLTDFFGGEDKKISRKEAARISRIIAVHMESKVKNYQSRDDFSKNKINAKADT